MRAYFARHLRAVPGGWRRYPERDVLFEALVVVLMQPHGLDLRDSYDGILWSIVPEEVVDASEVAILDEYAVARADREMRYIEGGPNLDTVDVDDAAAAIEEMLRALT